VDDFGETKNAYKNLVGKSEGVDGIDKKTILSWFLSKQDGEVRTK
jgi:hypothetical protein